MSICQQSGTPVDMTIQFYTCNISHRDIAALGSVIVYIEKGNVKYITTNDCSKFAAVSSSVHNTEYTDTISMPYIFKTLYNPISIIQYSCLLILPYNGHAIILLFT